MLLKSSKPVLVGIAGGTGSGKTHFVRKIISAVGAKNAVVIQQDAYYRDLSHLPFTERERINFDHPSSIEFDLLVSHLRALRNGQEIMVPVYDFSSHTRRGTTLLVSPKPLILIEGILVLYYKPLWSKLDLKIFLDAKPATRLQRRVSRDLKERDRSRASILRQYEETVAPMHREFVEPSKQNADFVIPYGENPEEAVDLVVSRLRAIE